MTRDTIFQHFKGNFEAFYRKYLPTLSQNGGPDIMARCPFHKDEKPSLSISPENGLYFCHGCGKKGDAIHFYAKLNGFDTKRDFGKILRGIASDFGIPDDEVPGSKPQAWGKIIATYDYVDELGKLLFQVCRMEPKDFTQRKPNGKGGWIYSIKGLRRVLYRLPEILVASKVVLVEGEKDVDNLRNLGIKATCNPGGAGKWSDEYSKALEGKDVVLVPDNDLRGREHMVKVAAALEGVARSIRWLELPGLPDKGDVSDFIHTFTDPEAAAERLAVMISEAQAYTAPKVRILEDAVLDVFDFKGLAVASKKNYLAPWVKEQSIILISGWRGCGKTWFALSILDAIIRGEPLGPWATENIVPALYLDAEMAVSDVGERLRSLQADGKNQATLFIYSDSYANQLGLPRASLSSEKWRSDMKRVLITRGVKIWVLDNISSMDAGDENSKQDWTPINQWLLSLRFAGITSVLLHHTGKGGKQRGTSSREDNVDISINLIQPHDYNPEDGASFIVHFDKHRLSQRDLSLASDTEFRLIEGEDGKVTWSWGNVKKEKMKEILRMLDESIPYDAIAGALGCSKAYISKVKAKAIKDGYMSKTGKLTQTGIVLCMGTSDD